MPVFIRLKSLASSSIFRSPIKFGNEWNAEVLNRNSVYKERFPKAKTQMEERLQAFVDENAPLSGGVGGQEADPRSHRKSMVGGLRSGIFLGGLRNEGPVW